MKTLHRIVNLLCVHMPAVITGNRIQGHFSFVFFSKKSEISDKSY